MKIRLGDLRRLIREAADTKARTQHIVQQVVDTAEEYVSSVVAGSPDKESAAELRQQAEQIASYAKFLIARREEGSDSVGMVAKYASDLAELSDFWKRPTFLGKQEYTEKLQGILKRMQKFQVNLS